MKRLPVSQIDAVFANGSFPIEFFFFYPGKIETTKIRKALKTASGIFWPLFGIYQDGIIQEQQFNEEKYFTEKNINQPFDEKLSESDIYYRYNTINPEPVERLLFISVLQFSNGTALIPKMSHLAGDGYSYFYFLMFLSSLVSTKSIFKKLAYHYAYKPLPARTVLKEFRFQHQFKDYPRISDNLNLEYVKLSKKQIRQHIKNCSAHNQITVSTNDIICGYILKKFADLNIYKDEIELTIPVDIRNRIKEYGPKYFGNGLLFSNNFYSISEIKNLTVDELAIEIRKSASEINTANYMDYLSSIEKLIEKGEFYKLKPYDPYKGCLVTNLSKLPANKLNFGKGKPEIISTITKGKNSVAVLAGTDNFVLRMMY